MDFNAPTVAELVGVEGVDNCAAAIEIVKLLVFAGAPLASVTRIVTALFSTEVGVPLIVPVELDNVRPAGREPVTTEKTWGEAPPVRLIVNV